MVQQSFIMIQECEKMNKNILSFLLLFLIIFSLNSLSVSATNENNNDQVVYSITGYSKFVIEDEIKINSQFNASWESSITLSDQIGTDLLQNHELGLRAQIDIHLGNSDGFVDSHESELFDQLFRVERNWTNSESGGCCIFDYNPLYSSNGINLITSKVNIGPIELENSTWGWEESTDLFGQTDSRNTRIIDFPRVGALIEEVPLLISLPEDWEYTYSAMEEIFSGNPGALIAILIVAICAGFLPHNVHPARIFMGDGGALLLGLLLAASTVSVGGRTDLPFSGQSFFFFAPIFIPLIVLGVPLFDMTFAIIRRVATRGIRITQADKNHLHHRLLGLGHGHRRAVLILWAWTALLSGFVLWPTYTGKGDAIVPAGIAAVCLILFTVLHPRFRSDKEVKV